jgi:hypothetical protein
MSDVTLVDLLTGDRKNSKTHDRPSRKAKERKEENPKEQPATRRRWCNPSEKVCTCSGAQTSSSGAQTSCSGVGASVREVNANSFGQKRGVERIIMQNDSLVVKITQKSQFSTMRQGKTVGSVVKFLHVLRR